MLVARATRADVEVVAERRRRPVVPAGRLGLARRRRRALSTASSASRLAVVQARNRRGERLGERRAAFDRHVPARQHRPGVDPRVDQVDREPDPVEPVARAPRRPAGRRGSPGTAPWWTLIVPCAGSENVSGRMIALSSEIATSAPRRRSASRASSPFRRRDAHDLRRDGLERRAAAGVGVRTPQREPDGRRRDPDATQLAERSTHVAAPDRLVEDHRPGTPREEPRRDPAAGCA